MQPVYNLLVFYFSCLISLTLAQNHTNDDVNSYCFQFTWLGPTYDSVNTYNGSCANYTEDTNAVGIPCRDPLWITSDGDAPNLDYLFENNFSNVTCRRTRSQVCARYSFIYNSEVQNVTYMCTKVYDIDGGVPVTGGCYTQSVDGYDIELCVCESSPGMYKPCNNGILQSVHAGLILAIILFTYLINWL